jgi:hypothetical protein
LIEFSRGGQVSHARTIDAGITADEIPWTVARVHHGELVRFSRIADLPAEAGIDARRSVDRGGKAGAALPLLVGSVVVGGLVLETLRSEHEPEGLMQRLRLVGEVFVQLEGNEDVLPAAGLAALVCVRD